MTRWQRRARLFIAIFAAGFAVVVAFALKRRGPERAQSAVVRTDPDAVVESSSGRVIRVNRTRENVTVEYEKQLTYKDGSTKLFGVKVVSTERGSNGRTFTVTAREGSVGQNDSTIVLNGDVRLEANDGLSARTEHAVYHQDDRRVRAPGAVEFSRKRLSGSGMGMTYDEAGDLLVILDQAKVFIAPERAGDSIGITSGGATLARRDKSIVFERHMKAVRTGQVMEAEKSVVHLTENEDGVERVDLRANSRITGTNPAPGGLQSLTGRDMDLKYGPDGETLQQGVVTGDAVLVLASERGTAGRRISASTLEITFGPDGATPVALGGRDGVELLFPADQTNPSRTIKAATLDGHGEPGKGLTSAQFTGDVDYRERGASVNRVAKAAMLKVGLKPGLSSINDATFTGNARFAEDDLFAVAAVARYALDGGTLQLSGSEPGILRPHLNNDRIVVDSAGIDVTLVGPQLKATGDVRSVLQSTKKNASTSAPKTDTKMPSMLKDEQPVYVVGEKLDYDGRESKASYAGRAKLWQADTTIQADTLLVDNKKGDLAASGSVTTSTMLERRGKDKTTRERERSIGNSKDFTYEDTIRRATYTGDAHFTGPQGDMTAARIELYLRPSGAELDKAEAYGQLTLREQNRKTTGTRMTYTTTDETYVVTGVPVTILDQCGRETIGHKLTFAQSADTISVDGSGQVRTQTKGGGDCR